MLNIEQTGDVRFLSHQQHITMAAAKELNEGKSVAVRHILPDCDRANCTARAKSDDDAHELWN